MRLLLDTQLAIWWLMRARLVPASARELLEHHADRAMISRVSLFEMAIKTSVGKLDVDLPRFVRLAESDGFEWLDLRNEHVLALTELPVFKDHRDPFDRMLVAQCLSEPLILLTSDRKLDRYGTAVRVV